VRGRRGVSRGCDGDVERVCGGKVGRVREGVRTLNLWTMEQTMQARRSRMLTPDIVRDFEDEPVRQRSCMFYLWFMSSLSVLRLFLLAMHRPGNPGARTLFD